jgi:hypothetical protein
MNKLLIITTLLLACFSVRSQPGSTTMLYIAIADTSLSIEDIKSIRFFLLDKIEPYPPERYTKIDSLKSSDGNHLYYYKDMWYNHKSKSMVIIHKEDTMNLKLRNYPGYRCEISIKINRIINGEFICDYIPIQLETINKTRMFDSIFSNFGEKIIPFNFPIDFTPIKETVKTQKNE